MDDKKQYLSASGYNLHGSSYSINLQHAGANSPGYRGSNEFICKLSTLARDFKISNKYFSPSVTDNTPKSTKEQIKEIPEFFKSKAKSICRKKILYKRVPILNWLPKYNSEDAVGDLVAGLTVGLTVIPQALAYAGIAQLPSQYGLYGSFLGCFIYIFLGSCKDVPMGKIFTLFWFRLLTSFHHFQVQQPSHPF